MKTHYTHLTSLVATSGLLCLSLTLLSIPSHANDEVFSWIANPEPLIGYKLYYNVGGDGTEPYNGTGIDQGDSPILIDKVTTFTVTGLLPDKTYYFALTAYDETSESDFTTIVSIPANEISAPAITKMSQN